jgi:type IV pilus assembly protein PilX
MNNLHLYVTFRKKQHGAALVVGLLLLVVITILAISGMNTATTELAMARNDQNFENAFQAAEAGLENALAQGNFNTTLAANLVQNITANESYSTTIQFENATIVPDMAFSLGAGSGVAAYHFLATSTAESRRLPGSTTDRDSAAVHTQAFYIVGPGAPSL